MQRLGRDVQCLCGGLSPAAKAEAQPAYDRAEKAAIPPGVYTAVGAGRNGGIPVTVEFSERGILSVTIGEHVETAGISDAAVQNLPEPILAAQRADMDVVSGVTYTGQGILDAVKDCIAQAGK